MLSYSLRFYAIGTPLLVSRCTTTFSTLCFVISIINIILVKINHLVHKIDKFLACSFVEGKVWENGDLMCEFCSNEEGRWIFMLK